MNEFSQNMYGCLYHDEYSFGKSPRNDQNYEYSWTTQWQIWLGACPIEKNDDEYSWITPMVEAFQNDHRIERMRAQSPWESRSVGRASVEHGGGGWVAPPGPLGAARSRRGRRRSSPSSAVSSADCGDNVECRRLVPNPKSQTKLVPPCRVSKKAFYFFFLLFSSSNMV